MILIVLQHIVALSGCFDDWVTQAIIFVEMLLNLIYFLQLKNNLEKYFMFQRIQKPIYWLISSYIGITLIAIFMFFTKLYHVNIKNAGPVFLVLFLTIFLIAIISIANFFIQYVRIGKRMINYTPEVKEFKIVGYFYVITPFLVIPVVVLTVTKTYQDWRHIFIITEILPLWYISMVYDRLQKEKDVVEIVSDQD